MDSMRKSAEAVQGLAKAQNELNKKFTGSVPQIEAARQGLAGEVAAPWAMEGRTWDALGTGSRARPSSYIGSCYYVQSCVKGRVAPAINANFNLLLNRVSEVEAEVNNLQLHHIQ